MVVMCTILATRASAAPLDIVRLDPAPQGDYIDEGAASEEEDAEAAPPPDVYSGDLPLGYSWPGTGNTDPPQDELTVLMDIRDTLQVFLALITVGISVAAVRFIFKTSLGSFTRGL